MLAVVPLWSPVAPPSPSPSCEVAIELHLKAPLTWGALEWHLLPRDADGEFERYGLSLCLGERTDRCTGWQLQLQVLVKDSRGGGTSARRVAVHHLGDARPQNGGPAPMPARR